MRRIALSRKLWFCIFISTFLLSDFLYAEGFHPYFRPYVGVEYLQQVSRGRGDWKELLPQNFRNGSVILGNKLHNNFSIELGYYRNIRGSRKDNQSNRFFNHSAGAETFTTFELKRKGFICDLNGYYAFDPQINFLATVGMATVSTRVNFSSVNTTNLANGLRDIRSKNGVVARLGVGAEYVERYYGVRFKMIVMNDDSLKFDLNSLTSSFPTTPAHPFRYGFIASLGIYYKF